MTLKHWKITADNKTALKETGRHVMICITDSTICSAWTVIHSFLRWWRASKYWSLSWAVENCPSLITVEKFKQSAAALSDKNCEVKYFEPKQAAELNRLNFHRNQETGTGQTLVWQNHWGGIKLAKRGEETEALRGMSSRSLAARKPLLPDPSGGGNWQSHEKFLMKFSYCPDFKGRQQDTLLCFGFLPEFWNI